MRTHRDHGFKVERDQHLALIGCEIEAARVGISVGAEFFPSLLLVREGVQRARQFDELRPDRRIMRVVAARLRAGEAKRSEA